MKNVQCTRVSKPLHPRISDSNVEPCLTLLISSEKELEVLNSTKTMTAVRYETRFPGFGQAEMDETHPVGKTLVLISRFDLNRELSRPRDSMESDKDHRRQLVTLHEEMRT